MNKPQRIQLEEMKQFSKLYVDMPDGAFFALAEDMYGWDEDDWYWYSLNT